MRRAVVVVLVALLGLGACVTPPRPFTDAFYLPLQVRRAPGPPAPVAVFAFADERPETAPTVVVTYEPLDGQTRVERATVPVGQGVALAFVRGLQARGMTVTDATARRDPAGDSVPARVVVTGRVAEFGVRIARIGVLGGYQNRVGCRLVVDVYDGASGRRLTERTYQRVIVGAMLPAEPLALLSRALADVVEQALADPAVVKSLTP